MLPADAATVTELNQRARADFVTVGRVSSGGVTTSEGTIIGTGDLVVTSLNQRDLHTAGRWVKNGDRWTITKVPTTGRPVSTARAGPGHRRGCPRTMCASTSNSATPPPPTAPKAEPSTPATPNVSAATPPRPPLRHGHPRP